MNRLETEEWKSKITHYVETAEIRCEYGMYRFPILGFNTEELGVRIEKTSFKMAYVLSIWSVEKHEDVASKGCLERFLADLFGMKDILSANDVHWIGIEHVLSPHLERMLAEWGWKQTGGFVHSFYRELEKPFG